MKYELAKSLKDAGWKFPTFSDGEEVLVAPTLEELIGACGDGFQALIYKGIEIWLADGGERIGGIYGNEHLLQAKTPTEAVARLWIALNPKKSI